MVWAHFLSLFFRRPWRKSVWEACRNTSAHNSYPLEYQISFLFIDNWSIFTDKLWYCFVNDIVLVSILRTYLEEFSPSPILFCLVSFLFSFLITFHQVVQAFLYFVHYFLSLLFLLKLYCLTCSSLSMHLGLHLSTHAEKKTRYIQYEPLLLFK